MEIKKKLVMEKSKYPDDTGNYIILLHNETKHGGSWKRIFKGSRKECISYRKMLEDEKN